MQLSVLYADAILAREATILCIDRKFDQRKVCGHFTRSSTNTTNSVQWQLDLAMEQLKKTLAFASDWFYCRNVTVPECPSWSTLSKIYDLYLRTISRRSKSEALQEEVIACWDTLNNIFLQTVPDIHIQAQVNEGGATAKIWSQVHQF